MVVVGVLALAFGVFMLAWPVRFAQIMKVINRNTPGEALLHNDPVRVAASRRLRLLWRMNGIWVSIFALALLLRGLGLI
jgi:hypothetical protein